MIIEINKKQRNAVVCCDYCKRHFRKSLKLVLSAKNHFCNKKCKGSWMCGSNNSFYGKNHTEATRSKISIKSQGRVGKLNPNWKNGRINDKSGYIYIYNPGHPNSNNMGYVFEHRLVIEKYLERYLDKKEIVHHINQIKDDNRLTNLILLGSIAEHRKIHAKV